jgi:P27 family predicted phage terminase small subunit
MQGRPPKPTALKIAEGNPGKRKLNPAEPKPAPAINAKPPVNSLADVRKFWRKYSPILEGLGLLTEADIAALDLMSIHYAIAKAALAAMTASDGKLELTREDEEGVERKHPMLQVLRDNSASFRLYSILFGLNPAARARLAVSEPDDDDDEFFDTAPGPTAP